MTKQIQLETKLKSLLKEYDDDNISHQEYLNEQMQIIRDHAIGFELRDCSEISKVRLTPRKLMSYEQYLNQPEK